MLTGALYQPLALGGVVAAPLRSGATWSSLIVSDCDAVPPRLVAVQVYVVEAESLDRVVGSQPVIDVMGETESVTVHVTVTSELFQPAPLGVGDTVGVMTGGDVSERIAEVEVPEPPLSSVTVTVTL